ncbi:UNVERIFIED_CONTAM: hypothetical protein K2H54_007775, partial [Gekko kuhli]
KFDVIGHIRHKIQKVPLMNSSVFETSGATGGQPYAYIALARGITIAVIFNKGTLRDVEIFWLIQAITCTLSSLQNYPASILPKLLRVRYKLQRLLLTKDTPAHPIKRGRPCRSCTCKSALICL